MEMDLQELRKKIDTIDDELIRLFQERMDLSASIAEYKLKNGVAVFDAEREREILERLGEKVDERYRDSVKELYALLFDLSKKKQNVILSTKNTNG
jgi:chorismate mutase/prephenate dehydratase